MNSERSEFAVVAGDSYLRIIWLSKNINQMLQMNFTTLTQATASGRAPCVVRRSFPINEGST